MKKEIALFKDKRGRSAQALVDAMRSVGMSDEQIKAEMLKLKSARQQFAPDRTTAPSVAQAETPARQVK